MPSLIVHPHLFVDYHIPFWPEIHIIFLIGDIEDKVNKMSTISLLDVLVLEFQSHPWSSYHNHKISHLHHVSSLWLTCQKTILILLETPTPSIHWSPISSTASWTSYKYRMMYTSCVISWFVPSFHGYDLTLIISWFFLVQFKKKMTLMKDTLVCPNPSHAVENHYKISHTIPHISTYMIIPVIYY